MLLLVVVPTFDEVEHGNLGLGVSLEASPIEQLALERGKEALGHRTVEAITPLLDSNWRTTEKGH